MTRNATFQSIGLRDQMVQVTKKLYFKDPTTIQQQAIPEILRGKHIIGQSQTGTGKTHAYLLPLLDQINAEQKEVQLVITAPTRELAMQIHEEIKRITELAQQENNWRTRLLVGGMDRPRMIKQLERPPHIVVGTPGRIADMVREGALSIYQAAAFVIDEADLMVEMGFIETIDELLVRCQKDIQTIVFSATIPAALQSFFKKYLQQPVHIQVKDGLSPEQMTHHLLALRHQDPAEKVLQIAKIIQPYVALLFVNSKEKANELAATLRQKGLNVGILHGGLSSRERTRMVKAILELKFEYIVATDLASRGIDIKGASHVINVELPKEVDFYIHRVGRTARAGLKGTAISFYTDDDLTFIAELEKKGIVFQYSDIKNDTFIPSKHYNQRQLRKNAETVLDKEAWKYVKKPKKIKPGYKKKMKQQQEKMKRRLKKQNNSKR